MKKFVKLRLKRAWRRHKRPAIVSIAAFVLLVVFALGGTIKHDDTINPVVYRPLLDLIAKAESGGNYNAYYGNASNSTVKFTDMSIADVLKWQSDFVAQGNASSAVGRYQMLNTTLSGLVQKLNVNPSEKFDPPMQDRLGVALLEKRGAADFMRGSVSNTVFAANLAMEWAGLPKVVGDNPEDSYYAGDGLNKAQVSVNDILSATEQVTQLHKEEDKQ